jgi:hypothetical protein
MVECFPWIETEQLYRVIDKRDLASPANVVIHVCSNNMRTKRNLDFVMGVVYAMVSTAKRKIPKC